MVLFILLTIIVVGNLVVGIVAAGHIGIGPGLSEILKWQPDFQFGQKMFERKPNKPTRIKPQVHEKLLAFYRNQIETVAEYECKYVPGVTSILDQLNASISKLPWVAGELEYYCRILDGRYYRKSVEQLKINECVKNANDVVLRYNELFETVRALKDCPSALVWIWESNDEFVSRFSNHVQLYFQHNQDQTKWVPQLAELTRAICELNDSLQMNWRLAMVKCYENKPYGQNWPYELFHDPVYDNKNLANALPKASDDRPMERTVALVEISCLKELNLVYGRGVCECVLHYFQEHLKDVIKSSINATTISTSRFLFDVRTLNTQEFTEEIERFRANIAKSKLSIGPHVLDLTATATITQMEDDSKISSAVSKMRLLHDQSKSSEENKSWVYSDQSANQLAVAPVKEPIEHKLVSTD